MVPYWIGIYVSKLQIRLVFKFHISVAAKEKKRCDALRVKMKNLTDLCTVYQMFVVSNAWLKSTCLPTRRFSMQGGLHKREKLKNNVFV